MFNVTTPDYFRTFLSGHGCTEMVECVYHLVGTTTYCPPEIKIAPVPARVYHSPVPALFFDNMRFDSRGFLTEINRYDLQGRELTRC
jgi:hypothetical protein